MAAHDISRYEVALDSVSPESPDGAVDQIVDGVPFAAVERDYEVFQGKDNAQEVISAILSNDQSLDTKGARGHPHIEAFRIRHQHLP